MSRQGGAQHQTSFRWFTIPMRGNENLTAASAVVFAELFTIPMRGNEATIAYAAGVRALVCLRSP